MDRLWHPYQAPCLPPNHQITPSVAVFFPARSRLISTLFGSRSKRGERAEMSLGAADMSVRATSGVTEQVWLNPISREI